MARKPLDVLELLKARLFQYHLVRFTGSFRLRLEVGPDTGWRGSCNLFDNCLAMLVDVIAQGNDVVYQLQFGRWGDVGAENPPWDQIKELNLDDPADVVADRLNKHLSYHSMCTSMRLGPQGTERRDIEKVADEIMRFAGVALMVIANAERNISGNG